MAKLKIRLKKGLAGKPEKIKKIIRALGLNKTGDSNLLEKTKAIEGMVKKVSYMLECSEEK
jgi:large subunit ribosomal protein L30